jgi:hypothetical protein
MSASKVINQGDFPQIQFIANLQEGEIQIEKPKYKEISNYSYNFANNKSSEKPLSS